MPKVVSEYPERYLLKLRAGVLARIDAVGVSRAEFIRGSIEAALGGRVYTPGRSERDIGNPFRRDHPDHSEIAAVLRDNGPRSEGRLCEDLGWTPLRVSRRVADGPFLVRGGLVHLEGE